jgi:hypothetical protein
MRRPSRNIYEFVVIVGTRENMAVDKNELTVGWLVFSLKKMLPRDDASSIVGSLLGIELKPDTITVEQVRKQCTWQEPQNVVIDYCNDGLIFEPRNRTSIQHDK